LTCQKRLVAMKLI